MAKGGSYELEISKRLSLWYTGGVRDDLVCRTDMSGGRATVRSKQKKVTNKYLYGDLKHSDDACLPMFNKWSIECKTGYGVKSKSGIVRYDVLDLLDSQQDKPVLKKMWDQCVGDAEESGREPILIFRRNGRGSCILMSQKYMRELRKSYGKSVGNSVSFTMPCMFEPYWDVVVMNFDRFLGWADPVKIFNLQE